MFKVEDILEGIYIEEYVKGREDETKRLANDNQLKLAYKAMLNNPDGKRVLWDILSFCGVFRNAMTGNSKTYFNLGQQSVGQYIMLALNVGNTFEDVLGMQKLKPEKDRGGS